MFRLVGILLCLCLPAQAWTHGNGGPVNSSSGFGTNLSPVAYYSTALPFTNILQSGAQWYTSTGGGGNDTNEENILCLDANGWPVSLTHSWNSGSSVGASCTNTGQTFTEVSLIANNGFGGAYPSGTYDLYYPSGCTWTVSRDGGSQTNISAGHDQFTVTSPSNSGILLVLSAIGTNNCNPTTVTLSTLTANFRANCVAGGTVAQQSGCFNPVYTSALKYMGIIRFMDWMCTNNNTNAAAGTWAGRPTTQMPFYVSNSVSPTIPCGVPAETIIALGNVLNANIWINVPTLATVSGSGNWVAEFASLVNSNLNSNLKSFWEYSNETWNSSFSQYTYMYTAGQAEWNSACTSAGQYLCSRSYYGMIESHICTAVAGQISSSAKYVCLLGGQTGGNAATVTDALKCALWASAPCTGYGITAMAMAPYIGADMPSCWTGLSPDGGLTQLFGQMNGTGSYQIPYANGNTTTDTGGNTNFQLTSGLSLSEPIPNCTGISFVLNVTPGTSPTLQVDTSNAWPILNNQGVANDYGYGGGQSYQAFFTTTTSGGSVTSGWWLLNPGAGYNGGWLAQAEAAITQYADAVSTSCSAYSVSCAGFQLLGYEGGSGLIATNNDSTVITTLLDAANLDARMGTLYTAYMTNWISQGGQFFNHYFDIAEEAGSAYGLAPNVCCSTNLPANSPKFEAWNNFNINNPQSWATH